MAIRPGGMTDEEFKRLNPTAPGAQAGAAVGQSLRTAGRFGASLASELARPPVQGFNTFFGGIDKGVQAANNFVASAVTGRPVSSPIAQPPMLAAPRPVPAAPGASASMAKMSPGQSPSQSMTLDQASQREVAARIQAPRPGTSLGAGASTTAGRAALRPDGVAVVKMPDGTNAYGANGRSVGYAQGTMGTVNTQNFGNPVVPQAPGSIARPGVASTFGLGVNDPRLQAPPIARPGQLTLNPNGNAETFNARQDREASKALASDLGTEAFMLRGKTDPASLRAMAEVAQTRAGLLSGTEGLSAAAIQGSANRGNAFGIADLNNAGENNRAGIQADVARSGQQVTREGQQLDFQAAQIQRPSLERAADGSLIQVSGTSASPVVGPDGKPVIGQPTAQASQRDYAREADDKLIADLLDMQRDATGVLPPNAVQTAQQQFQALRSAQGGTAPPPAAIEMLKKDPALAAQFDQKYGQGAAARYAK